MMPNTAALLSRFMRAQPEVAALIGQRFYTVLPASKTFPLGRAMRIGGGLGTDFAYWLDAPLFQVDLWADTAAAAFDVAETCRYVLATRFVGVHDYLDISGVVTSVTVGGLVEGFDPDDPKKARDHFDVVVHAHPLPSSS